jgi:hypothetical protein
VEEVTHCLDYHYGMTRSQQISTAEAGGWSLANRIFGVGFRRETYANLAYLLTRFPLGIAYFTVLITGLSLGWGWFRWSLESRYWPVFSRSAATSG